MNKSYVTGSVVISLLILISARVIEDQAFRL